MGVRSLLPGRNGLNSISPKINLLSRKDLQKSSYSSDCVLIVGLNPGVACPRPSSCSLVLALVIIITWFVPILCNITILAPFVSWNSDINVEAPNYFDS